LRPSLGLITPRSPQGELYFYLSLVRITIINETGERVLDTLLRTDKELLVVKQGVKSQLKKYADEKGPTLEQVKSRLLEIIRGRTLVAYHINLKLNDLGIWNHPLMREDDLNVKPVDIATLFNRTISEQ
jgi:hypothetical protein